MVENVNKGKSGITVNVNVSANSQENIVCVKKSYISNPKTCTSKNCKYLGNIVSDSVIRGQKSRKVAKTVTAKTVLTKTILTKPIRTKLLEQVLTKKNQPVK